MRKNELLAMLIGKWTGSQLEKHQKENRRKKTQIVPDRHPGSGWCGEAAEQGHVLAQNNLDVMYANGKGVPVPESPELFVASVCRSDLCRTTNGTRCTTYCCRRIIGIRSTEAWCLKRSCAA